MYGSPVESDRACVRKVRYETWSNAESACLQLIDDVQAGKARRYKGGYLMAYLCDYCAGYHIGHAGSYITRRAMNLANMPFWTDYEYTGGRSLHI